MLDEAPQAVPQSNIKFIRDVPADDDFFTTHTRVAEAIVRAVEENSEIKVIGLLGRWGSGKSTVANKVIELVDAKKESGFRVFTYDAWLHQSDPLRRSFLESLIGNLVQAGAIEKGKWTKKLKELSNPVEDARTIETPVLSPDARLIGLTLVAVPIGIGLVELDTLEKALGENPALARWTLIVAIGLILLPALTWGALYLKRRPWSQALSREDGFWRKKFWAITDEDGAPTSALQIFEEGQTKHTTTRTFRSTEPTSLEFGRMFQKIMREAADRGHRIIILIDNLDRVAEAEALGMWATIRSFFLASDETDDVTHEPFHPTVILPIDRHAVEELFAGTEGDKGGRDRARSFMDKTFDVTFEVTEPVHSDWREFLALQMKSMFGESYQSSWGFWTRRLFESQLARQQADVEREEGRLPAIVTPREINKLLNRVGALYLQWGAAGIPVEVMSLYVIRRDEIDRGLLTFLQSHDVEISEISPDWKRQLAALHYGVELEKAAQVLLAEPIRKGILGRDQAGLKSLSAIPGFGEIFEFATSNLPEPTNAAPYDILANAVLILESLEGGGAEWATNAWRNLAGRYADVAQHVAPQAGAIEIIKVLSEHIAPEGREAFIGVSSELLSRLLAPASTGPVHDGKLRTAAEHLIEFAVRHDLPQPTFKLGLDPKVFVSRLSELSISPTLWKRLRTSHSGEALTEAVVEMLGEEGTQKKVPSAVRCLTSAAGSEIYDAGVPFDFNSLAVRADQVARQPENFGGDAMSGIRVLADVSHGVHREGLTLMTALVDEGVLANRLNEVVARADWDAAAIVVAILLWRRGKFEPPSSLTWHAYAQKDPNSLKRIVAALRAYFPGALVPILWTSYKTNYSQEAFVQSIIGYAVEADLLGEFNTKPVFDQLHDYWRAVPPRLRDRFMEQVDNRTNLLAALEDVPLGPQATAAAVYLRRKGGAEADRADVIVRERVEGTDAATWSEAIRSGSAPFDMAKSLVQVGDVRFPRRSGLYDALSQAIPKLVQSGGRETRARWLILVDLMKPKQRKTLLEALGSATEGAPGDQILQIMKAGGVQFLKTGGFAARANKSVRSIIIPQLAKKDGRTWLKDNKDELSGWVQRADQTVRDELSTTLNSMLRSQQVDRRYSADILAERWGLKSS